MFSFRWTYLFIHYFAHLFSDLPEIEVERSWVHSGEGYEAQLVCIVHAEPHADVSTIYDKTLNIHVVLCFFTIH